MGWIRPALMTSLILLFGATAQATLSSREAADARAKEEFLKLNFFADGRGVMAHALYQAYEKLSADSGKEKANEFFARQWGFNIHGGKPIGLVAVPTGDHTTPVLTCVVCHSGKAAGQFVVGLGNKGINFDWYESKELGATSGLIETSLTDRWFYQTSGEAPPPTRPRGYSKIPALWGYATKRDAGLYSDGMGVGPAWLVTGELASGQTHETVRGYLPKILKTEKLFEDFLPPKYPRAIAKERAERGKVLFKENCVKCHGTYEQDADGLPIYKKPKWIRISDVGTDTNRIDANDEQFYRAIAGNPLKDIMNFQKLGGTGRGYLALRLVGVWARFPYLHNGSVPNIAALLSPPAERPKAFDLSDAGEAHRFDEAALGLTVPSQSSPEFQRLLERGKSGDRLVHFAERPGLSNRGHAFGTKLAPNEKADLIEYLRTL